MSSRERGRKHRLENPDSHRRAVKRWSRSNPGKDAARIARRHARRLQATPVWADLDAIEALYREAAERSAREGIPFHVDHVIPLQGDCVCGLHLETNLRLLPGPDNWSKGNRFTDEDERAANAALMTWLRSRGLAQEDPLDRHISKA